RRFLGAGGGLLGRRLADALLRLLFFLIRKGDGEDGVAARALDLLARRRGLGGVECRFALGTDQLGHDCLDRPVSGGAGPRRDKPGGSLSSYLIAPASARR